MKESIVVTFKEIFLNIARTAMTSQNDDGSMPAGHNGPYKDPETSVRNTSHYLMTFLKAWELSGDEAFKSAAEKARDYLLEDCPFRDGFTFHHRSKEGKDKCNGLIGPAWNMESLWYAYEKLGDSRCLDLAKKLFLLHPFDDSVGVWSRIEPDGTVGAVDCTLNHQIWFAAAGAGMVSIDAEIAKRIECFLNKLVENWRISRKGRIYHPLLLPGARLRHYVQRFVKIKYNQYMIVKEAGYHAFNLYAFAMLKEFVSDHAIFKNKKLLQALSFLDSSEFRTNIRISPYGYPYNPPGFEITYANSAFGKSEADQGLPWVVSQLESTLDMKTWTLSRNTPDPVTLTARIYESVRFPPPCFEVEVMLK